MSTVTTLAADTIRRDDPLAFLGIRPLLIATFLLWFCALAGQPATAADYASPSFRAWQRDYEAHLTIEWSKPVRVQQKKERDRLVLRFADPLEVDPRSAFRDLSHFVDLDRTTLSDRDLSLALLPGVISNVTMREKGIVAVDFFRDITADPKTRIQVSAIDQGLRLTFSWPGPTRIEASKDINEQRLKISPAWKLDPVRLAKLQTDLKPWLNGLRSDRSGDMAVLSLMLEPQIVSNVRAADATITIVDLLRDASALPAPAAGVTRQAFIPRMRPKDAPIQVNTVGNGPPIPKKRPKKTRAVSFVAAPANEAAGRADGPAPSALVIDWKKPVGAAVFVRAGHLWVVFDETDADLLSEVSSPPSVLGPGSTISAKRGTALRFPLLRTIGFVVERTSAGQWRIEPTLTSTDVRALPIVRAANRQGLRLASASARQVVSVIDPTVGDRVDVLPMQEPRVGQLQRRRYVDFELLPTMQGAAWRPLNDRLDTDVDDGDLIFSSPQGLSLSTAATMNGSNSVVMKATAGEVENKRHSRDEVIIRPAISPTEPDPSDIADSRRSRSYFDLADSGVDRQLVGEFRRIRRQAITDAAPEDQDRARLDLAHLLISERLAGEARTILRTISEKTDLDLLRRKRALSGISALLLGRLEEASSLLLDLDLKDDPEIEVWRAALDSSKSDWPEAAERWQTVSDLLDRYPPRLKFDLGRMALEAAIETDNDDMVDESIERLASLTLDHYDEARVEALKARHAERKGDLESARTLLDSLAESPNPAVRTLADFQLATLNLSSNVDGPESLETLDRRMPLWRGHPRERFMLDRLARRHKDANALRSALTIWQRLINLYPEAADDGELEELRRETFIRAFSDDTVPGIDAFDVYTIYLDFTDLLPDDPKARIVHRQLAKQLAKLDLLNDAIDVLQALMTSATDRLERAEIASEIATLMLEQDRAVPALSVLDGTEEFSGSLPPDLDEQRGLLRARAQARLDRVEAALRTLRDQPSREARRLQAEILWNARRWPRLAAVADSYLDDSDPTAPLHEDDQEIILWLALALQQESTTERLSALRDRFDQAMQGGPYAEAFEIATQSIARNGDIESLLSSTENQLAELKRFLRTGPSSP